MREWSVLIERRAPEGKQGSLDADDSRVSDFIVALAPWSPAVSVGPTTWSVRLNVPADEPENGIDQARATVGVLAHQCRFPSWPIDRIEVVDAERLDVELEHPSFPDLVGTSEVSEMLGVSRQRIHELRKAGRFPAPMVELAAGPIWVRATIESFDEQWIRKPGRPNQAAWTDELVKSYRSYTAHTNNTARTARQFPHQRDLVVHLLVNRLGVQNTATVLGVDRTEVEEAMSRPGVE